MGLILRQITYGSHIYNLNIEVHRGFHASDVALHFGSFRGKIPFDERCLGFEWGCRDDNHEKRGAAYWIQATQGPKYKPIG